MSVISVADVARPIFCTCLRVRTGDLNYGNHLANDAVLRLCHEARMRWLTAAGMSEFNAGGSGLIMTDAAVQYRAQAHHGDELMLEMGAEAIGGGSFTLLYRLTRVSDGLVIARVQTGMACFDYGKQRVCRMPSELKRLLEAV